MKPRSEPEMTGIRVLIAPDKFKGTLSGRQAADAIAVVVKGYGGTVEIVPIADRHPVTASEVARQTRPWSSTITQ
jgi:glycerate kinase